MRRKQEPLIIVDIREASSAGEIVKGLKERGVNVKIELLEKGNHIKGDCCFFVHSRSPTTNLEKREPTAHTVKSVKV